MFSQCENNSLWRSLIQQIKSRYFTDENVIIDIFFYLTWVNDSRNYMYIYASLDSIIGVVVKKN